MLEDLGCRGWRKACRALSHVQAGSASPMETALTMMLCLPVARGGFGLPLPELNEAIGPLRCGLYWPAARLALEYDSNAYHTGARRIAHDAQRRAELARLGVEVVTVTHTQVIATDELAKVARIVAGRLGRRVRAEHLPDWPARHGALRREVLA